MNSCAGTSARSHFLFSSHILISVASLGEISVAVHIEEDIWPFS